MVAPHFYVKPAGGVPGPVVSREGGVTLALRTGVPCARAGCGLPPEHPVHLRPTGGDQELERAVAG